MHSVSFNQETIKKRKQFSKDITYLLAKTEVETLDQGNANKSASTAHITITYFQKEEKIKDSDSNNDFFHKFHVRFYGMLVFGCQKLRKLCANIIINTTT